MIWLSSNHLAHDLPIDDVTTVYLQQTQGIGLSIHLNELLYYFMAHYMACVSWRKFWKHMPWPTLCVRKLPGKITIDIAMMRAHIAGHDITCHIIYTLFI